MVKTRVSEPAPSGSLARLWAEFNDPGPAGDTLVMLKKYGDGVVPGCMGLVFLVVGLTVMVLFFRVATTAGKTWVPVGIGAAFALAGFGVFRLGLSTIARKTGAPR
jgi:hypothetical protein